MSPFEGMLARCRHADKVASAAWRQLIASPLPFVDAAATTRGRDGAAQTMSRKAQVWPFASLKKGEAGDGAASNGDARAGRRLAAMLRGQA
jgi:hypothetical protein